MNCPTAPLFCFCLCLLGACRQQAPSKPPDEPRDAPTNRIAVPESVRRNLGIEYLRIERRRVAQTLRLPGHFELLPAARYEHRVPVAGRVDLLVQPLQSVKPGDVLYRIDSPQWRRVQRDLGDLATAVQVAQARLRAMQPLLVAHEVHENSLRNAIAVMEARVRNLEETRASVGGQGQEIAAVQVQLAQVQAALAEAAEKHAEADARVEDLRAQVSSGQDRSALALEAAATLLGTPVEQLSATIGDVAATPAWRRVAAIEGRATVAGLVDKLPVAHGVWVEPGELVMTITDLSQVRFRARALQSDLASLKPGLPAQVVLPQSNSTIQERLVGTLALGIEADPVQRTIDLFLQPATPVGWARPGIAGFLEVEIRGGNEPELAVPLSAVLQDGLQRVLFRRDPADPDQVIRLEADLGIDDGRWVEVKSGVRDGDEVVLAGAYELMLASSGSVTKGGHFHADGTLHEDTDHQGKAK